MSNSIKYFSLLLVLTLGSFGRLHAQDLSGERYWVSGRIMTGIDIVFDNVGTLPADTSEGIEFFYNNGFVDIPETGDAFTSDFQFDFENANVDDQGFVTSFTMERFNSVSQGTQIDASIGRLGGWEGGYSIPIWRITPRITLRAEGGMSIVGIDTDGAQTIEATFFRQTAEVDVPDGVIEAQDSGTFTSGGEDGPVIDLQNGGIVEGPKQQVTQFVDGELITVPAEIDLTFDVNGITAYMTAGAHLEWYITRNILLDLRSGFSGTFFSTDLLVGQTIRNATLGQPIFLPERQDVQEWLPGYYVDFGVTYTLNRQVSAFASYRISKSKDVGRVFFNNFSSKVSASTTKSVRAGMNFTY